MMKDLLEFSHVETMFSDLLVNVRVWCVSEASGLSIAHFEFL